MEGWVEGGVEEGGGVGWRRGGFVVCVCCCVVVVWLWLCVVVVGCCVVVVVVVSLSLHDCNSLHDTLRGVCGKNVPGFPRSRPTQRPVAKWTGPTKRTWP